MRCAVELPNVHDVVLILEDCRFVIVNIKVVWGAEDGHHAGKTRCPRLPIHSVTCILSFMGSDDREKIVFLKKGACGWVGEEIGAASNVIMNVVL